MAVTHCRSGPCADAAPAPRSSWEGERDRPQREPGRAVWPTTRGGAVAVAVLSPFVPAWLSETWLRSFSALQSRRALSRELQIPLQHRNILFHQSNSQPGSGRTLPTCRTNQAKPVQIPSSAVFPAAFFFFSRCLGVQLGITWLSWKKAVGIVVFHGAKHKEKKFIMEEEG